MTATGRETIIAQLRANVPAEMRSEPRWVLWRTEEREGKATKVPVQTGGQYASSTAPKTWIAFEEAVRAFAAGMGEGVGFVLGGGWSGIDLDGAVGGGIERWAEQVANRIQSYTEVSPSGRGLHIVARGAWPGKPNRVDLPSHHFEAYDGGRFFTVTGRRRIEWPAAAEDRAEALAALHRDLSDLKAFLDWAKRRTKGPEILALMAGDTAAFVGDDSRADMALCSHLGRFASGDAARIDRLFRLTRLNRDKWDRDDYRTETIRKSSEGEALPDPGEPEIGRSGPTFSAAWPDLGVAMAFSKFRAGDRPKASVTVTNSGRFLGQADIALTNSRDRHDLARDLGRRRKDLDWDRMLALACWRVEEAATRSLQPQVVVMNATPAAEADQPWLVRPFVMDTLRPNLLIGPPGGLKSYVWQVVAATAVTGRDFVPPIHADRVGPVLVLDFEWDLLAHQRRLGMLARGHGIPLDAAGNLPGLEYARMTRPLEDEVPFVLQQIDRVKPMFLIVDGLMMAMGKGADEKDAAVRLLQALRELSVPSFLIGQQSKEQIENHGLMGYGSVALEYEVVLKWRVRKLDSGTYQGGHARDGWARFRFEEGKESDGPGSAFLILNGEWRMPAVRFQAVEASEMLEQATLTARVKAARDNGFTSAKTIARVLGRPEDENSLGSIRRILSRLSDREDTAEAPGRTDEGEP